MDELVILTFLVLTPDPFLVSLLFGFVLLVIGLLLVFRLNPGRQKVLDINQVLVEQQDWAWLIFDGYSRVALRVSPQALSYFGINGESELGTFHFDDMFFNPLESGEMDILLEVVSRTGLHSKPMLLKKLSGESFEAELDIRRVQRGYLYCALRQPAVIPSSYSDPVPQAVGSSSQPEVVSIVPSIQPLESPSEPISIRIVDQPTSFIQNEQSVSRPAESPSTAFLRTEPPVEKVWSSLGQPGKAAMPVTESAAILSYEGRFMEVNEAFSLLTGYSVSELKNLSFEQLLHPEDAVQHQRWFSLLGGDKYRVIRCYRRIIHRDGKLRQLELIGAGMPAQRFVVVTAIDTSLEEALEQKLRYSQGNLLALVENTGEAIFSIDTLGRFIVLNARYRELFSRTYGYALREELPFIDQLPVEERRTWKEYFNAVMTGSTRRFRMPLNAGETGLGMFEVELYPVRESGGIITGLTFSGRDVSERISQERALLEARDKAEEATRAKSEFLALMSHEIRTPLNGLLGISELLNSTRLDSQQKEFVDIIRLSGEALLQVINDVLDFSKIEANRMQLENAPFRLKEVVEESLTILSSRAKEKGLVLEAELSSAVPEVVVGDKVRLRQVLLNLIGNAIKFTEQGSVKVVIVPRDKSRNGVVLGFEVRDTGVGIDLEKAKGLFSAFTQADASTFRKYGGSGLGLTICKNIVELMGGKIWVESQPGEGSSFFFTIHAGLSDTTELPAGQQRSPASNDGRPLAEQAPLRILLVEDNDINRLLAVKLLERLGYQVVSAADGKEAYTLAQQHTFDLVFMDVQMPEWDGLEATRHIRADLPRQHQPIIVAMTAFAGAEDRKACLVAGMDDYVSKPITTGDLERVILKWGKGKGEKPVQQNQVEPVVKISTTDFNTVQLVENAAIQRLMEIARQSDPGFVQQVMELFMKQAPTSIRDITAGAVSGDMEKVWKAAHKLKGTSLQLGAARLGSVCKDLEESGRQGDTPRVKTLADVLEKVYNDTVSELKSLFQYN